MSGKVPFTIEQIDADLRSLVDATAGILAALFHFTDEMRDQFLGVEVGDQTWWDGAYSDGPDPAIVSSIPLDRHPMVDVVRQAYAYAYQQEGAPSDVETLWCDVAPVSDHLPTTYVNGLPTQMNQVNGLLHEKDVGVGRIRKVLDTFQARYHLNAGNDLTVDDLALLADMAPTTVRTSLSKEGLRLYDPTPTDPDVLVYGTGGATTATLRQGRDGPKRNMLANADARDWLSRRRGFIPNMQPGTGIDWKTVARNAFAEDIANFPAVLKRICNLAGMDSSAIRSATGKDLAWVEGLLNGKPVEIDIDALVALAGALHVEPARFASQAVAHLLRAER